VRLTSLLSDLDAAVLKAPNAPSVHIAISNVVSHALCLHGYALARALVNDHHPTELTLRLPHDWQARGAGFDTTLDGVAVRGLGLATFDGADPAAVSGEALPADLVHLACKILNAGAIRELHVFNAMAQGTVTLFCSALKGSGIEAFHFVPHFASDAQLDHHSVQADAVLEALGGCSHLAALSVNMTCMDAGLSTHVLHKGGIVQLTVDLNHHDADIVLPRGLVAQTFQGLAKCPRLESLKFRHCRIEAGHFNDCILKCVGANASLKEIVLDSDLPLHGGRRNVAALANTFKLLGACISLTRFTMAAPVPQDVCAEALDRVYFDGRKEGEYEAAGLLLAKALAKSSVLDLSINGFVFHDFLAFGLMHGVGLNRKLQTLDLSGCSFTLNSSPAYIRELMKNKSLREVVLPDPRTLTFRCHSDTTLNDLVEIAGVWELNSTSPAAQVEFANFAAAGGGAGAFAANLRELASVKVARHNRHLQDLAVRSTLAFNVSDFLAKHYSDLKARQQGVVKLLPEEAADPDLFGIAGQLVFEELLAARAEESAVRLRGTRRDVGLPVGPPEGTAGPGDPERAKSDEDLDAADALDAIDAVTAQYLASLPDDVQALARGLIYDGGFIPLQVAALRWDASAIAAFCEEADDVNAVNVDGDTALHCMLIDLGQGIAKLLAEDPDQWALARRFLDCVKTLIDAGADPTLPDAEGNTFLDRLLGFVGGNATYPTIPKVWEPVLAEVLRYINQPRPAGSGLAVPVVNL
jgi:hypothetical protein